MEDARPGGTPELRHAGSGGSLGVGPSRTGHSAGPTNKKKTKIVVAFFRMVSIFEIVS
jgi:hypothetical protein